MTGQDFGEKLLNFIFDEKQIIPEQFLRQALLNYLSAVRSGQNSEAVNLVRDICSQNETGRYTPFGRKEQLPLSDCVLLDCYASSVQAYDDIHFGTSTHPCGPIVSAIFGIAREKKVNMKAALHALYIGMETECRIAVALFSKDTGASKGWYPTGIAGGIGAAAAAGFLLHLNKEQMKSALALAASYAGGVRGTHGSMAGTFVPAVAAVNGFRSAVLASHGFTCSFNALTGKNGLLYQIASNPAFDKAMDQIGTYSIAAETSCKPYPLGYISFPVIDVCRQVQQDVRLSERITLSVSSRAFSLGANANPLNADQAIVSLPFIAARTLLHPEEISVPLDASFAIPEEEKELIGRIALKEDSSLQDNQADLSIRIQNKDYEYRCSCAEGSKEKPMSLDAVIQKYKRISSDSHAESTIHLILEENLEDIWNSINK